MKNLYLHVPTFDELDYRQKILGQEDTMSYNKGYNLLIENYNNETGCIDFSKKYWEKWYAKWILEAKDRYYAYIVESNTGDFVGEVCFYYEEEEKLYRIGIVIESVHRGKGYCSNGLIKLADVAFNDFNIKRLRNVIPLDREYAIKGHKKAGFKEVSIEKNQAILDLSNEDYLGIKFI
ncbi:GNAT family N-acetyltransferase [Paraclostridium sordellii]|uniref:GNAT family N-acetyltransferase n=1 Tax=Paraclostridium sordellii TaxID=1505 RepID=UPI0005E9FF05|nr:GNAT family N-acetyltransferase [Paeniclostridium sordellii]CEP83799.1 N-acetyltransferase GCN5 [[Clostridium] sordellii] [Paeniclostridium sordellii]